MNALNIIEDNEATPNMDSSSRKRQRVTHKPSTTMTSPSALNLNNFKNLRQSTKSALKVYEDEEDGIRKTGIRTCHRIEDTIVIVMLAPIRI